MPTIYDFYRIEWDGNSLSCENDVIIGYNASNKTRLEFVNTSPRTNVRFTSIEFRTPLSRIGFDLPDDGKIELSLNPFLYGEDSDLALFWEDDGGKAGASHMRVTIVESEYYHDEETEAQADDNTQEINQLKARVSALESFLSSGAGAHNSIYRGKNLGSNVTAEQYEAISAGTFDDLYIGDYWTIGGVTYRIAAFDYYLQTGDIPCTDHHVTIVPDGGMYDAAMNDTDTTDGGYYGSKLRTSGLDTAKATISSAFGADHILTHRQLLSNAVSGGEISDWAWYNSQVELLSEKMVYGSYAWGGGVQEGYNTGIDKSQLSLFQARPDLITIRQDWYLRDVQSAAHFCGVTSDGYASFWNASTSLDVRPVFSIIG